MKKDFDATLARVAGNILSGMFVEDASEDKQAALVRLAVKMARAVVAEIERTQPEVSS